MSESVAKTAVRDITRPDFIMSIMGQSPEELTQPVMRFALHEMNPQCQLTYTALMNADIKKKDIDEFYCDGGAIVVIAKSKSVAEKIVEKCEERTVKYGSRAYKLSPRARGKHVIVTCEEIIESECDE